MSFVIPVSEGSNGRNTTVNTRTYYRMVCFGSFIIDMSFFVTQGPCIPPFKTMLMIRIRIAFCCQEEKHDERLTLAVNFEAG